MHKIISTLVLVSIALMAVTSCKKKTVEAKKSLEESLTGGSTKTWMVTDGIAKQQGLEVNLIESQNPCITDNLITFKNDFTYTFQEGATKCNPNDPDLILTANWEIPEDESYITIDKFIFLNRTISNPKFILDSYEENKFSGTTTLTLGGETFDVLVTFEAVQ